MSRCWGDLWVGLAFPIQVFLLPDPNSLCWLHGRPITPREKGLRQVRDIFREPADQEDGRISSVQFSCSVVSDSLRSHGLQMPGFPVHHQLPELIQTHVYRVSDAIQPSHPLSSPSPPTFKLSQHHGLFKWVSSSQQVAQILEFELQHLSFQWIFRTDFI